MARDLTLEYIESEHQNDDHKTYAPFECIFCNKTRRIRIQDVKDSKFLCPCRKSIDSE